MLSELLKVTRAGSSCGGAGVQVQLSPFYKVTYYQLRYFGEFLFRAAALSQCPRLCIAQKQVESGSTSLGDLINCLMLSK